MLLFIFFFDISYSLHQHPSIRQFPSEHFYQKKLKDAADVTFPDRLAKGRVEGLWPAGPDVRLVFCHVVGQEESPHDCTGAEGREESKFNEQEVKKTVSVGDRALYIQQLVFPPTAFIFSPELKMFHKSISFHLVVRPRTASKL